MAAGANLTIVAGLTASGSPALTPFVNDVSAVGAGRGRLVVRHTAAAPAVDVYAGTAKVISGLVNGQQQALTVPAGTVSAKVTLAGQTAAVLGPVSVPVTAGMATVVYAIGSAAGHTLTAVTQQYPLGGMASSAQAGSGGSPGQPSGATVLVGHVDSAASGPGALFRLQDIRPGAAVTLVAGRAWRYVVRAVRAYAKAGLPAAAIFGQRVTPRLVIITCGGPFDTATGHYLDNIVAWAVPA